MGQFRTVYASIGNVGDHLAQDRWADYHRKFVVLSRRIAMPDRTELINPFGAQMQTACVRFEIGEDDVLELKHDLRSLAAEYGRGVEGWGVRWDDAKPKFLLPYTE